MSGGGNVTLEFEFGLREIAGNVSVREVMYTGGGFLCYLYDGLHVGVGVGE